jgi:DNA polymerase elongation subunit (family B)/predicted RNA-binding Zn-ribbon protein involved in translation (DUF1610 family)
MSKKKKSTMKVLILDIENTFILGGVWGLWGENIGLDQILDGGHVLSYAFKWYGERGGIVFRRSTDVDFLSTLHNALSTADAVVTYNGKRHDVPLINREFIKAGYAPPAPFKHIDLIESIKRQFKFPSNKLAWVLKELGLPAKEEHEGFPLWIKVIQGDEKAWKRMERYNVQDVRVTEQLYTAILPWILNHPNHNLYGASLACPNCGSVHLHSRGLAHTLTQSYRRYQCVDCGKWSRERFTAIKKEDRHNVLVEAV